MNFYNAEYPLHIRYGDKYYQSEEWYKKVGSTEITKKYYYLLLNKRESRMESCNVQAEVILLYLKSRYITECTQF